MAEDQSVHPEIGRPPFGWCGPWEWRDPSHGEHFRTCSFCGSINPDDLVAEPEWRAEWADRKYGWPHKFYVDVPNREPDQLFVVGGTSRMDDTDRHRYVPVEELTAEQQAIVERDGWTREPGEGIAFGTRAAHHAKFYTIHLRDSAVSAATRAAIEDRSGLAFTFTGGSVSWRPAEAVPGDAG